MTRTVMTAALFLTFACGASMRPIPDDVEPVPRTATATALPDAGLRLQRTDAGSHWVAGSHTSQPEPCSDTKHRPLEARRIAPDEWIIASGVMDVIRSEEKATVAPQIDATGRTTGLVIEDVGENSCLGALGFQDGDVLRTINDVALAADWSTFPVITASVNKNGSALVRFERNGHPAAVLFEVRTE